MPSSVSKLDVSGASFQRNRARMLELVAQLRSLEARASDASAKAKPLFDKRGQLLPRERIARLLDPGAPWLELSSIAGFCRDNPDPAQSIPGSGMLSGIGYVNGVRSVVVASDSGIDAGAIQAMGREKLLRAQDLALDNKLPFVHLVGGRQPAQVQGRRIHPRRLDLPQPCAAFGCRRAGRHGRARVFYGGWRIHAGTLGLRDHGARARQGFSGRAAAAQGGDGRDRDR
jgi:hypothetical protein